MVMVAVSFKNPTHVGTSRLEVLCPNVDSRTPETLQATWISSGRVF